METLSEVSPQELSIAPPAEIEPLSNQPDGGEQQPGAEVESSTDTFLDNQKTSLISALRSKLEGSKSNLLALSMSAGLMVSVLGSSIILEMAGVSPEKAGMIPPVALLFLGMRHIKHLAEKDQRGHANNPDNEPK